MVLPTHGLVLWVTANILRSPMGRAMVAIRDSEVSAQSMGINLAWYKTVVFALSDMARFFTGQVMAVNGGFVMN